MKALCDLSVTGYMRGPGFDDAGFFGKMLGIGKSLCCGGLATKFPGLNVLTW
jgi:hypothetical protein